MRPAALAVVCVACGSPEAPLSNIAPAAPAHELLASLQRTECYGTCPAYTVTVYRDGAVEYVGDKYVKTTGKAEGHATPAQLEQLKALFDEQGYLTLHDAYTDESWTDMPSATTSYAPPGGVTKQIRHYLGDEHAPKALAEIENGIDRILDTKRWIGAKD